VYQRQQGKTKVGTCSRTFAFLDCFVQFNSSSALIMLNSAGSAPTNATQTKERLYAQLAMSLGRTARAISQTADLCEQLQVDLHAMRIFAGLDAAK
jgi:hypothetical protein